jgi:hypothetical protein
VLEAVEATGTAPLVFKGAALAHTHYQHSWLRPRLDADLLIAADTREHVFTVLTELGYARPAFVAGDLVMYQAPFERVDHLGVEHVLDIHWRIGNPQLIARLFTHDELVARALTITVQGRSMRVPSPVDALMLACIHRAAHHHDSEDPIWLEDIHLIATRLEPQEWSSLEEQASQREVRAICARGLSLAIDLYQTRVPADVMARLSSSPRREPSAVYLRKDLRPVDRLIVDLRAIGKRRGQQLIREHLFPPAEYMEATYGVRRRELLPAYYALRAVRGVSKWLRREPKPTP